MQCQTFQEVLNAPDDYSYQTVKSLILEEAMSKLVSDRDSAFVLIDSLISIAKNQKLVGELSGLYEMKAETYMMQDLPRAAKLNFLYAINQSQDSPKQELPLRIRLAYAYSSLGNQDSAYQNLNIAAQLMEEVKDSLYYPRLNMSLGSLAYLNGQYITALDYLRIAEENAVYGISPTLIKVECLALQAQIYSSLGDIDISISYLKKAIEILAEDGINLMSLNTYKTSLAGYYIILQEYDQAIAVLNEVEKYFGKRELPQKKLTLCSILADAYLGKNKLITANNIIVSGENYLPEVKRSFDLAKYYLIRGKVKTALGEYEDAHQSFSQLDDLNLGKNIKLDLYLALKELAEKQNDTKKTLSYTKKYYQLKDSLFSIQQTNLALDYESRYNRKEQEKSISELNMINDIQSLKLQQQRKQFFWFAFLLAGLIALLYMAYLSYSRRKKNEEILSQKNSTITKALNNNELLLKEIHHRVKNNLQVVSSILSLQSRQIEDKSAKKVIKAGQDRIRSMALIHQNLHQSSDLLGVSTKEYLEELIFGLSKTYNLTNDQVKVEVDVQDLKLSIDLITPLGLIANELISNAMKYAFSEDQGGIINVKLTEDGQYLNFSVKDDGLGLPADFEINKSKSLGYRIVSAFTKKLKGEVLFPEVEKGTEVLIRIPSSKKKPE